MVGGRADLLVSVSESVLDRALWHSCECSARDIVRVAGLRCL